MNTYDYAYYILKSFEDYGYSNNDGSYSAFGMFLKINYQEQSYKLYDSNKKLVFEYDFISDTCFISDFRILNSIVELINIDIKTGDVNYV